MGHVLKRFLVPLSAERFAALERLVRRSIGDFSGRRGSKWLCRRLVYAEAIVPKKTPALGVGRRQSTCANGFASGSGRGWSLFFPPSGVGKI